MNNIIDNINVLVANEVNTNEMLDILNKKTTIGKVQGKPVRFFKGKTDVENVNAYYLYAKKVMKLNYFILYYRHIMEEPEHDLVLFKFVGMLNEDLTNVNNYIEYGPMDVTLDNKLLERMDINKLKEDIAKIEDFFANTPKQEDIEYLIVKK